MTTITIQHTLTLAEIDLVLDEHCDTAPPIDPPVEPPIDPPPIEPPIATDLYSIGFSDVWGQRLSTSKEWYSNEHVYNRKKDGTSMLIKLPNMSRRYGLRMTAVENTGTAPATYGIFSWRRDFAEPFIDEHIWGPGGGLSVTLSPEHSGMNLYFNHQIASPGQRFAPWWSTLQCMFRAI